MVPPFLGRICPHQSDETAHRIVRLARRLTFRGATSSYCRDERTTASRWNDFPTAEQAASFAHDPGLRAGMEQAGVEGAPRIEIFTDV
jgi:hypothetical protein